MAVKKNILIIGSTGRNIGKTEFACRIIENHSTRSAIFGVKVIPIDKNEGNCHRDIDTCGLCNSLTGDYKIIEDRDEGSQKDTSRMLKAGARRVFLLLVDKNSLEKGMEAILAAIPEGSLIIIESNTIRKVIEPGLFLVINKLTDQTVKPSCTEVIQYADKIVGFQNMDWDFPPDNISIKNESWIIT